jgi:hypothetical protein
LAVMKKKSGWLKRMRMRASTWWPRLDSTIAMQRSSPSATRAGKSVNCNEQ